MGKDDLIEHTPLPFVIGGSPVLGDQFFRRIVQILKLHQGLYALRVGAVVKIPHDNVVRIG